MPSVLFVLTSADTLLDGGKTGWFLPEAAHPYYVLDKAGVEIDWASPKGGKAPLDPGSVDMSKDDKECQEFLKDDKAQKSVNNTLVLSEVDDSKYDAIFYVGGHGQVSTFGVSRKLTNRPMLDLAKDPVSIKLAEKFFNSGRTTAAVCHAPGVFDQVKDSKGEFIVKGRKVTAFSNVEEEQVEKTKSIPFLPEDSLKRNGGDYVKAKEPWGECVQVSDNLITGQNPASAKGVGEAILKAIRK